jgi:hypothetical protein
MKSSKKTEFLNSSQCGALGNSPCINKSHILKLKQRDPVNAYSFHAIPPLVEQHAHSRSNRAQHVQPPPMTSQDYMAAGIQT